MRIAVRNLHRTGIGGKHPFHDYILAFLRSGVVTHLFFEDKIFPGEALANIRKQYGWKELGLDRVKIIFSAKELEKECDILISFDSRLEDFSPTVRSFSGIKIYHLMDYFWGEPLSVKMQRLHEHKITYLMSYGSPDRYCSYFKKYGQFYIGKVIPVPFGFGPRFTKKKEFKNRIKKCLALGSVRPLRFQTEDPYKFKEQADALLGEIWFHKFRRMLVEHKQELRDVIDSKLPEFPQYRDYDYDQVAALNEYQMFVSDESLFYFPSAKAYEGPATGAVMVCSDHPCFSDYGFRDGINCITHKEFDIENFKEKSKKALTDQIQLLTISKKGEDFVRTFYSHESIGKTLARIIRFIYNTNSDEMVRTDIANVAYTMYQETSKQIDDTQTLTLRSFYYWFVYTIVGGVYYSSMQVYKLLHKAKNNGLRVLKTAKRHAQQGIHNARNKESSRDAQLRKHFISNNKLGELPAPTSSEQIAIDTLRAKMRDLPEATGTAGPEHKWALFARTLRSNILEKDPRTFLSWEVVNANMVYRAGHDEFSALHNEPDWEDYWKKALEEPLSTLHQPFYLLPKANENSIRQAYHLQQLRALTGKNVRDFDTIVDFGGGYGSMARIVRKLGFTGTYIIFDWKEFSLLQEFYLSLAGVILPVTVNTLEELAQALTNSSTGKTLLIATWSLSEVSPDLREKILEIIRPDTLLITYQKEFGGVNNQEYFSNLKTRRPEIQWTEITMKYLPTECNKYLIGVHE